MNGSLFSPASRAAFASFLTAAALTTPIAARAQDAAAPATPIANAAEPARQIPAVTMKFKDAPIRQALAHLFHTAGLDWALDPNGEGLVTIDIVNVPFETAFTTLLRAAPIPLTYTRESGVYIIKPGVMPRTVPASLKSNYPYVVPNNNAKLTIDDQRRVSFDGTAPIRTLLIQLMQQNGPEGTPYIIAPQVMGNMTITLDKAPFATALKYLLSSAEPKLTYKKENNVYIFEQQNRK